MPVKPVPDGFHTVTPYAESTMEPADMFYGDRHGGIKDPRGNTWWIATHIEDVPQEELQRRAAEHAQTNSQASDVK